MEKSNTVTQVYMTQEDFNSLLSEVKSLKKRVEDIEFANDAALFTAYMGNLDKPDIYRCIEMGVSRYFDIPFTDFYDSLLVGNRRGYGSSSKLVPADPRDISNKHTRLVIARQCLFAILHIEFHVPISLLSDFYNVNPTNYIKEWRERFLRIYYNKEYENTEKVRFDEDYERFWRGCFEQAVLASQENGLYDKLIERLSEGKYNKLHKWRIK